MLTVATARLVQDDIDLAIRYGELPDSDMVARLLHPGRRVVCVAPALAARVGLPAVPRDLAMLPTLVLTAGDGAPQEWRYHEDGKRHSLRLQGAWHSNDGEILRRWAVAGHGYAYKSLLDIGDDLRAGRLQTVLDDYFDDSGPLNLLSRRSRFQPPRVALLADFLLQQFAALPECGIAAPRQHHLVGGCGAGQVGRHGQMRGGTGWRGGQQRQGQDGGGKSRSGSRHGSSRWVDRCAHGTPPFWTRLPHLIIGPALESIACQI